MDGNDAQLAEHLASTGGSVDLPDSAVEPDTAPAFLSEASSSRLPSMPDITKAQLIGLVPIAAKFGTAFGLYHLSAPEQESLTEVLGAGVVLIAADAAIRHGRALLLKAKGRA